MLKPAKFICILLLSLFGSGLTGRGLDEIKRSGKIYVAFTSDDLNNINYDLALEFALYLNVEMIGVEISWDEAFMKNGVIPDGMETDPTISYTPDALKKADIICSTFTMIEWRRKLFGFAETLPSAELLLVNKNSEVPLGYEGLAGKEIAFVGATTFEQHLNEINNSTAAGIKLVPTGSSAESKQMIENGKVFGIVLDADEALNFTAESGQKYKIAFPISDITRMAWAVEMNNPLIQEVENFFETIASNGVLDEFFYRRFGITYSAYLDKLNNNLKLKRYHRDLDEILASKKLVIALRDRNFIYRDGGQKQFMHALAEEFADHLGVGLEFVVTPYFGKYWEADDGNIYRDSSYTPEWFNYFDLACEIIAPLDWRTNKVNMVPVYPSAYMVVAGKNTEIHSLEDLKNLKGVTDKETVYEDILRANGIGNYYYEKVNNFLTDVETGKADYTIIYNAFYELNDHPGLEAKLELGQLEVSWALRKDQPQLQKELQEFIAGSRENGLIGILLKALRGNTLQAPEEVIHSYYESFQTGQMPYVNYGADDGLPQEDIFSIFQDRKGYLWFGTNSGAVRYNGREMVVFNHEQGLPANSVKDIRQDSSGTLYFATTSGIAKFRNDTTTGILLEGVSFNRIFIDSKDNRWFMGDDGLYVETSEGSVRHLNGAFSILPATIYHMTEDPETGNLLMATILGVFMYNPAVDRVTQLSNTDSYSLFIDANDSLWISTREGLFITNLNDLIDNRFDAVTRNMNKRFRFPANIISDIFPNKFGSVWLVTDSRIMQVISTDQEPIIYEQEIGIKNNKILSFLIDREDNIWIGFSGGLQRLTNRKGIRNFYPGTIDSYIYSVFEDNQDRIWITSDNGIFYFKNETLVNFTPRTGSESTKFCGTLLPGGNILLTSSEGLIEVDSRTMEIIRHNRFDQIAYSPENLFVTSRGEIFLLTGIHGVIFYFSDFQAKPLLIKNRYTSNIFQLIEHEGRIIGGNSTGFVVFNGSGFELMQETGCSIWTLRKEGNDIWVGTDCGIGLIREGQFDRMELSNIDRDLVIKSILPARNRNYIWLGTNKGFSYFNTSTQTFDFTINTKDGLSGDEITPGGLFMDKNDLLWVGTYHGISNFNIRAKSNLSYAPVCYIEKMFLNGEITSVKNGEVFSHNQNNFVFEISALSFSDEASVEYEFYLRGTGNKYSSYHRGSEFRAYYNNLPPGKYEFIYKAKGKNNIWGYAQKYDFTINKAWYNTWLFRVIIFLVLTGMVYTLYMIRIRTIKDQKNRLEEQLGERSRVMEIANTIQRSLLPGEELLKKILPEHFILYKSRDIVGGDFYWVHEGDAHVYVAAADCTGHGVAGALMSMLGMTLMNEIVSKQPQIDPEVLLNTLRGRIIETLHQKGGRDFSEDGMDMVVCKYGPDRKSLQFAGAGNPLYLIRGGELTEYKTDPMHVSIHEVMNPFRGQEISMEPGDRVYLFSDGYADQFGGPGGRKFKYHAFKKLIVSNADKPMKEQGAVLETFFESWKGGLDQIDDVVVIGLKF